MHVQSIRDLALECKLNKSLLGKNCPSFISTRWLYDYEICSFLLKYSELIRQFTEIPENLDDYFQIVRIFKNLILIFESPNSLLPRCFMHLERALNTFEKLKNDGNIYAELFQTKFLDYTLHSEEGGLWILSYLLSAAGHDDFYERIEKRDMS